MNQRDTRHLPAAELRQRAETRAREQEPAGQETVALSVEQGQQALHELRVHQLELEMQNEELRRTQAELDATRRRYFDLYELAPVGYLTLSLSGEILEANLTAATLLGAGRVTLTGQAFSRFICRQDQDRYYLDCRADRTSGAVQRCELRLQRADGTLFWAQLVSMSPQQIDGRAVTTLVLSDISDRKQMEEALRRSEQGARDAQKLLELVLDTIPVRLFWKDLNSVYLGCNRLFAEDAGFQRPEELIGADDTLMGWQEQADQYRRDDHEVMTSCQAKLDYEEIQTTPEGKKIWLSTSKVPLVDDHGQVIGILGTYEDITRRKWQEDQLLAAREDLEQRVEQRTRELQETQRQYLHAEKLSAIGKLSASIAHEFNNPLQGILAILKGLRKRAILEAEDRELLDAAINESQRIKELIRSLQEFNRPTSGRVVAMDLHKAIDSLLLLHKSDFKGRRISVTRDYAPFLPQLFAVPDQIKQVLLNLLTNAADACQHPGGVITIRTRHEADRVSVAIKDTGIGIEPEAMERVFQPFYTTKPAVKGTGLGLSVSYGIVTSHQGEIRVESRPGVGSTFTVLLPIGGLDR